MHPYLRKGMTVLDFGCGPGLFSIEAAKIIGGSGKVIAADLQEGMLDKVRAKISGTGLENNIELHKCQDENIGVLEKVDFVLAFYVVHEVPDQDKLFMELKSILKPGGQILIVEPKFHISDKVFEKMIALIMSFGLEVTGRPKVFFSRAVVLRNKEQ